MPHSLIVGMTESGKTTLAQQMAESYRANGIATLVLDPLQDPKWDTQYQYNDPAEFLRVVKHSQHCAVFVDESGDAIGRYGGEMNQLATRGRHFGHNCYFITQRAQQLDTTVRAQCSYVYLFASSKNDCKILAEEFNEPEILAANKLGRGEYYKVGRFSPVEKFSLF